MAHESPERKLQHVAEVPRSASGLSSLEALNERKRKEVSPVGSNDASQLLLKRQRHPIEAQETRLCSTEQALAEIGHHPAEWQSYIEQVTPANAPTPSEVERKNHSAGILSCQFQNFDSDEGNVTEDELVNAITAILENICSINNGRIAVPPKFGSSRAPYRSATYPDGSSSVFFSLQKPAVDMRYYVARLVKYMHVSTSVFVVALIYLDRVHAADEILALTDLNVHRLITTALGVACKFLEDEVHRNSTVSRIGGVPSTSEMNLLESQFLRRMNWDCSVSVDSYELYRSNVFKKKEVLPRTSSVESCPSSCSVSPDSPAGAVALRSMQQGL